MTTDLAATARKCTAALRDLQDPTRHAGRNGGATERAIARHTADLATALATIDNRALVGAIVEENNLVKRLDEAKRQGITRPELTARLKVARAVVHAAR